MRALLGLDIAELKECVAGIGEKPFRAKQLYKWLAQGVAFEDMTDLSKELRGRLREEFSEGYPVCAQKLEAKDGTVKYLFRLADGNTVESVYMPKDYGNSVCVSTQVGCAMGCAFCASCEGGLARNLDAGEILGQVVAMNRDNGGNVTNIVLMGMGEPLENYESVVKFIRLAVEKEGLNMSRRGISLSTCGIVDGMDKLAEEGLGCNLCVSLHAPVQEQRETLMPSARKNPLPEIIGAAKRYFDKTGRRIIFEYALIDGFNNSGEDADALAALLKGLNCHVNIIPLNGKGKLKAPPKRSTYAFCERLKQLGLSATVRVSMGAEIEGACGQLRKRELENG